MCFSNLHNIHFCYEVIKFKNTLAIFLIVGIYWLLWVLRPQVGNRSTIGLLLLIILSKFIVEGDSGFLMYVKVLYLQLLLQQTWFFYNILIRKVSDVLHI